MLLQAIFIMALTNQVRSQFNCELCTGFVDSLQEYYLSEQSLTEQKDFLVINICPTEADPVLCESDFRSRWTAIAAVSYPVFVEAAYICGSIDLCPLLHTRTRFPSCPECVDLVNLIADEAVEEENINNIIAFLQGGDYCGQDIDETRCKEFVATMLPLAIPALATGYFKIQAASLCRDLGGYC